MTPSLCMNQNIVERTKTAKTGLNLTWSFFVSNRHILFNTKYELFQAAFRAISCYGAEVWGNKQYSDLEKLQRYFVKKAIGASNTTPNYAIKLETGILDMYQHTMKTHMSFILKLLFEYGEERLPKKLANIIIQKGIDWWMDWKELGARAGFEWNTENRVEKVWRENAIKCLQKINSDGWENAWSNAERSSHGLYRFLNYETGCRYLKNIKDSNQVKWIFKARTGMVGLNACPWKTGNERLCSLCNMKEDEDITHFLGRCPILREVRIHCFGKITLSDQDCINLLDNVDGDENLALYRYLSKAWSYRSNIVAEYI